MKPARCSAVGTVSSQNKTLQRKPERNEESCDTANANPLSRFHLLSGLPRYALSQRPSSLRFAFSKFGSPSDCAKHLPYHHPLNTLRVELNPASQSLTVSRQVSSFLLKFLHAPLYPKPWPWILSMHGYCVRKNNKTFLSFLLTITPFSFLINQSE